MAVAVYYGRVSTRQQGNSGLGLEAQKQRAKEFAKANGFVMPFLFEDVASGKDEDRPELKRAIAQAAKLGCPIIVAELSRLSRRLGFICELLDQGAKFYAADLGIGVDTMTIQIFGAIEEANRKRIGERTKLALKVAKERGQVLGNPNIHVARKLANKRRTELANLRALKVVIETIELMMVHAKDRKRWGLKPIVIDGDLKYQFGWLCPGGTITKEKLCGLLKTKTPRGKTYNVVGLNRAIKRTIDLYDQAGGSGTRLFEFTTGNCAEFAFSHTFASRNLQYAEAEGTLLLELEQIKSELEVMYRALKTGGFADDLAKLVKKVLDSIEP